MLANPINHSPDQPNKLKPPLCNLKNIPYLCRPTKGGISGIMIIINVKDGESLDKALKRFKKKFEKTGVLRELRSRQAFEKKSVTRRHVVKHAIYKQNMNLETAV